MQIYAPYVYDATMVIAAAMQAAGSREPMVYGPYLASVRHEGVTGLIQFDGRGNLLNPAFSVRTYRDGALQVDRVIRHSSASHEQPRPPSAGVAIEPRASEAVSAQRCELATPRFVAEGDLVHDTATGLVWSRCNLPRRFDPTRRECIGAAS